jgi:hypothetical protein
MIRIMVAALLVVAGEASRRAAIIEDRIAATQEQLTMQASTVTPAAYDEIESQLALAARIPFVGEPMLQDVRRQRALAAYWNGDYATAASTAGTASAAAGADARSTDPALLFVAANAAFRDTIRPGRARADLLRLLDESLQQYGEVLKVDPQHGGAAYNYEFVGRLRTALARGQRTDQLVPEGQPNMHGEEGDPPQGTKPPEFNVIVPMRPDERQEQFDAGVGGVTRRRG